MATSDVIEDIQDAVTCAVCLSSLTDPKSLQCLHSFCLNCLEQMHIKAKTPGTITCPICRTETSLMNNDLNSLPNDFRAKQVQVFLKHMQTTNEEIFDISKGDATDLTMTHENTALSSCNSAQKQIRCEVCLKNGQVVDLSCFCFDCAIPMCPQCSDKHNKRTHFKGHVICEVNPKDLHLLKCTNHNGYIQAMCAECWVPVCKVCIMTTHTNHDISAPQMTSGEEDATVGMIKKCNSKLHQGLLSLNELEKQHTENMNMATDAISYQKAVLLSQIDDEEQKMRAKIQHVHQKFIHDTATFRKQSQEKQNQIDALQKEAVKKLRPFSFSCNVMLCNRNEAAKHISAKIPTRDIPEPEVPAIIFTTGKRRGQHILGDINFGEKLGSNLSQSLEKPTVQRHASVTSPVASQSTDKLPAERKGPIHKFFDKRQTKEGNLPQSSKEPKVQGHNSVISPDTSQRPEQLQTENKSIHKFVEQRQTKECNLPQSSKEPGVQKHTSVFSPFTMFTSQRKEQLPAEKNKGTFGRFLEKRQSKK